MTMTVPELIEWLEDSAKGADQTAEEKDSGWWSDGKQINRHYDVGYYRGRRDAFRVAANYMRQSYYLEARPKRWPDGTEIKTGSIGGLSGVAPQKLRTWEGEPGDPETENNYLDVNDPMRYK